MAQRVHGRRKTEGEGAHKSLCRGARLMGEFETCKGASVRGYRLRLPFRFFQLLGGEGGVEVRVAPVPGGSALVICAASNWAEYGRHVRQATENDPGAERVFLLGADRRTVDSEGRVTLDKDLARRVGISRDQAVVVLGVTRWVEVWSEAKWTALQDACGRLAAPTPARGSAHPPKNPATNA